MKAGLASAYFNYTYERGLDNSTLVVKLSQTCSANRQNIAETRLEHGKPGYEINLIPTEHGDAVIYKMKRRLTALGYIHL